MTQILWLNTEFVLQDEIYPWQQFYVSGLNRYNIISNISSLVFVAFSLTELLFPGDPQRNVVMWMDHRATEQADRITKNGHRVLSRVGGVMSPEMQPPKLLWLKEVRGEQGHHWSLHVLLLLFVLAVQQIPGGLFFVCFFITVLALAYLSYSCCFYSHTLCLSLIQNLKENCWNKASHFFDLPDFLSWKASGSLTRWAVDDVTETYTLMYV